MNSSTEAAKYPTANHQNGRSHTSRTTSQITNRASRQNGAITRPGRSPRPPTSPAGGCGGARPSHARIDGIGRPTPGRRPLAPDTRVTSRTRPMDQPGQCSSGAEPWSSSPAPTVARRRSPVGFLALHGFTGNPSSMRGLAGAVAGAGCHVELPRLPGHGTTVEDDARHWLGRLDRRGRSGVPAAGRPGRAIVVAGLSMGGSLDPLERRSSIPRSPGWLRQPGDPAAAADVTAMIRRVAAEGTRYPGVGSDIADPDAVEIAYGARRSARCCRS